MRAWGDRNRRYLVALILIIPAAVVVTSLLRWIPYLQNQPVFETVALGEVVRYGGADIELTALEVLDGEDIHAQEQSDVVVATFSIDVVDPPESTTCEVTIVSTEYGVERSWGDEVAIEGDFDVDDRYAYNCDLTTPGAYEMQLTFLVPRDQVREPIVQFSSSAAVPQVLRLR